MNSPGPTSRSTLRNFCVRGDGAHKHFGVLESLPAYQERWNSGARTYSCTLWYRTRRDTMSFSHSPCQLVYINIVLFIWQPTSSTLQPTPPRTSLHLNSTSPSSPPICHYYAHTAPTPLPPKQTHDTDTTSPASGRSSPHQSPPCGHNIRTAPGILEGRGFARALAAVSLRGGGVRVLRRVRGGGRGGWPLLRWVAGLGF